MIRSMIEGFFFVLVPFFVIGFLVLLFLMLWITGKFDKEEPSIEAREQMTVVEGYCAEGLFESEVTVQDSVVIFHK